MPWFVRYLAAFWSIQDTCWRTLCSRIYARSRTGSTTIARGTAKRWTSSGDPRPGRGTWFKYAGDFKWSWQRDFFDLANVKSLFFELAGAGHLNPVIREKIHRQAKGEMLPGHEKLREEPGRIEKVKNALALVRIAVFG